MSKQETAPTCIKLYADLDKISDILIKGEKTAVMGDVATIPSVVASFPLINLFAIQYYMFPLVSPFKPFTYCTTRNLEAIIVGGYPNDKDMKKLAMWSGSSYTAASSVSESPWSDDLYEFITYNEFDAVGRSWNIKKSLSALQTAGVLLLPEVLSTFVGGNQIMGKLWEPFIWHFLSEFSSHHPDVPILFTTESAHEKFISAVDGSKYRFYAAIGDKEVRQNNKCLKIMEQIIHDGCNYKFNFFELASE